MAEPVITHELRGNGRINGLIYGHVGSHIVSGLAGSPRLELLFLHGLCKALLIHRKSLFFQNLPGKIQRKAVGVIEPESIRSVKALLSRLHHLLLHVAEDAKPLVNGLVKLIFLLSQHIENKVLLFLKLRITVPASLDHRVAQIRKERPFYSQQSSVARRTADDPAQHIASSLVIGHDSIRNHKGCGADMVSHDTDGNVPLVLLLIFLAGNCADSAPQCADGVDVENGIHILHHGRKPLKPHSGIYVLLFQLRIIALPVIVKLGEHIIPDLDIAVSVTAHGTLRPAAAVLLTPVIVNLGAGTAGAGAMLPEIILFPETENSLRRNSHFLVPDLKRLVVIFIDGRIEPVRVKSHHLRQKLPCPGDCLMLEIVPEGKIAQHLEKRAVAGGLSDIVNVTGADALLTGGNSSPWRNLLSRKIRL